MTDPDEMESRIACSPIRIGQIKMLAATDEPAVDEAEGGFDSLNAERTEEPLRANSASDERSSREERFPQRGLMHTSTEGLTITFVPTT